MGKDYAVYILSSRSRTLYVGVTGRLLSRIWQHREGACEGFTRRYRIHRLVWFEQTQDVQAAIALEKRIKGWRREKKIALIESANPTWEDLAAEWFSGTEVQRDTEADPSLRSG